MQCFKSPLRWFSDLSVSNCSGLSRYQGLQSKVRNLDTQKFIHWIALCSYVSYWLICVHFYFSKGKLEEISEKFTKQLKAHWALWAMNKEPSDLKCFSSRVFRLRYFKNSNLFGWPPSLKFQQHLNLLSHDRPDHQQLFMRNERSVCVGFTSSSLCVSLSLRGKALMHYGKLEQRNRDAIPRTHALHNIICSMINCY